MNIIKERINLTICPICKQSLTELTLKTKIIKCFINGNVVICKKHYIQGEEIK